jgi:hypothetical protein
VVEVIGAGRVRAGIEPGVGQVIQAVWDSPACTKWCRRGWRANLSGWGGAGVGVRLDVQVLASSLIYCFEL